MAWRITDNEGKVWQVRAAAEMRSDVKVWRLVLSFRATVPGEPRSFWAPYPLEASSKSSLFQAADRLPDEAIRQVLVQHLS